MKRNILSVIICFALLTSCSVEKRRYMKGYHVEWNLSKKNSKTTQIAKIKEVEKKIEKRDTPMNVRAEILTAQISEHLQTILEYDLEMKIRSTELEEIVKEKSGSASDVDMVKEVTSTSIEIDENSTFNQNDLDNYRYYRRKQHRQGNWAAGFTIIGVLFFPLLIPALILGIMSITSYSRMKKLESKLTAGMSEEQRNQFLENEKWMMKNKKDLPLEEKEKYKDELSPEERAIQRERNLKVLKIVLLIAFLATIMILGQYYLGSYPFLSGAAPAL